MGCRGIVRGSIGILVAGPWPLKLAKDATARSSVPCDAAQLADGAWHHIAVDPGQTVQGFGIKATVFPFLLHLLQPEYA